jgi:hypothetical protein
MSTFLDKILEGIVARVVGPMSFRFMLQPLVALLLGIRDGRMDAKAGTPAFIVDLVHNPENRKKNFASAAKSLMKPVIVGTVIDLIAQYLIFQHVRLIPAAIVGVLVMAIPYSLARGISNRIITSIARRKSAGT